jgi:hypothetical protein
MSGMPYDQHEYDSSEYRGVKRHNPNHVEELNELRRPFLSSDLHCNIMRFFIEIK